MTVRDMQNAKRLKEFGALIQREGMSERVINAVSEFDGSYKGAMRLAGRLKAIAQMANSDDYWKEQVDKGYEHEACAAFCWKK